MYENMVGSTHPLAPAEMAVAAIPEDERVWVPQAADVWFRPLMLNTLQGSGAISCGCGRQACCRVTSTRRRSTASC
jgi:hypothetical protein